MKRLLFATVFVTLFSLVALADIPRPSTPKPAKTPKQQKSIDTNLTIRLDGDAREARLIIPKSRIQQLRAELDELDGGAVNTSATTRNFTGTQTIVSGMFLTLAFVFGGVWLARSGKTVSKNGRALGIGAFLFLGGAFATFVFANAGPPPEARSINGKMFTDAVHMYKFGSGAIKLEVSTDPNEDDVELIVPDRKDSPKSEEE